MWRLSGGDRACSRGSACTAPMLRLPHAAEVAMDMPVRGEVERHQVHVRFERGHRVVNQCQLITDQVLPSVHVRVEYRSETRQSYTRLFDQRSVWRTGIVLRLGDGLECQSSHCGIEVQALPALPPRDIGTYAGIALKQRVICGLVSQVLNDRRRFPQPEVSIHQGWHFGVRIDREVGGASQFTLEQVVVADFHLEPQVKDDGFDFTAIGRARDSVQDHGAYSAASEDASKTVGSCERMRLAKWAQFGRSWAPPVESRPRETSLSDARRKWAPGSFQFKEIHDVWQQTPDARGRAGRKEPDPLPERERRLSPGPAGPPGGRDRAAASHRACGRAAPCVAAGWRGNQELSIRGRARASQLRRTVRRQAIAGDLQLHVWPATRAAVPDVHLTPRGMEWRGPRHRATHRIGGGRAVTHRAARRVQEGTWL